MLGIQKPDDWEDGEEEEEDEDEQEEHEEQEEEEEGDGGGGDGSGESGRGDGNGDSDAAEVASIAATEAVDEHLVVGDSDKEEEEDAAPSEPAAGASGGHAKKRQHVENDVSPTLARELDALDTYRSQALNLNRQGASVAAATRESDRARLTRFLVWVNAKYALKSPATLTIFAHSKIGAAAQRYIKELVETHERKYSYAAKLAASFVIAAKFVAAHRTTVQASTTGDTPVAQLSALHNQCRQQAHQQDKFDVGEKPDAWLDWEAVQRARVTAEAAISSAKTDAEKFKFVRDVTVLRLLADQPPDRVGVARTLQLGVTLKRMSDGYELDLSEPGAHKTSAVFGATRTTINDSITPWLDRYIKLADITEGSCASRARRILGQSGRAGRAILVSCAT